MKKYIAIYTKDLYPIDNTRIVNYECNSMEEATSFLSDNRKRNPLSFWNPQIYNTIEKTYTTLTEEDLK